MFLDFYNETPNGVIEKQLFFYLYACPNGHDEITF